jgi:membrane protein DedA with SNARE-associated domain
MKRQAEPLGVLMCLPLALLGAAVGAFVGLFVLLLAFGLRSGDGQIGLMAVIIGMPLGAAVGGTVGFRAARRLK